MSRAPTPGDLAETCQGTKASGVKCTEWLLYNDEIESGYCERCLMRMADQDRERREFDHFHYDDRKESQ